MLGPHHGINLQGFREQSFDRVELKYAAREDFGRITVKFLLLFLVAAVTEILVRDMRPSGAGYRSKSVRVENGAVTTGRGFEW